MKSRAIDSEDKAVRRADILAAARRLFLEDSHQLPSVSRIAAAASLAKGTVYLYFRTKEEIFTALLAEDFAGLLNEVHQTFSAGTQPDLLAHFVERYVAYLDARPELLRLDAMAYSVLEQNLSDAQLRSFKLELTQGLVRVGSVLDESLGLPSGRGVSLLMRSYALTRGLWQSLDFPTKMRALLAEPVFAPIRPDFRAELVQALQEYWRGAMASAPTP
ncbi:TetR family transcriptional regulator [Chitinimonas sp.]|uniref:TetR family transcriptional regulator n=1 Tax=Chitinimonas sp. TaxID=1934313 RepID=UPI0035B0B804